MLTSCISAAPTLRWRILCPYGWLHALNDLPASWCGRHCRQGAEAAVEHSFLHGKGLEVLPHRLTTWADLLGGGLVRKRAVNGG